MLPFVLKKEGEELYVWSDEARRHREEFAINLPTHSSIANYREVPIIMPGFDRPMGLHIEFDLHYEGYRSLDYPSGIDTNLSPAYFSLNGKVQPSDSSEGGQQEEGDDEDAGGQRTEPGFGPLVIIDLIHHEQHHGVLEQVIVEGAEKLGDEKRQKTALFEEPE